MDDRRFRTILRSVLAASFITPAIAGAAACVREHDEELVPNNDDGGSDATVESSVNTNIVDAATNDQATPITACGPAPSSLDCDAATLAHEPPDGIWWEGGVYEGHYWSMGKYEGGTYRRRVCGCADLGETNPNDCTIRLQYPCGAPLPFDTQKGVAECRPYCPCENNKGQPLAGCRGMEGDRDSGAPYLTCLYQGGTDPTNPMCGCAPHNLTPQSTCSKWTVPFPCDIAVDSGTAWYPHGQLSYFYDPNAVCPKYCNPFDAASLGNAMSCHFDTDQDGLPVLQCGGCPIFGRRPDGLTEAPSASGAAVGVWLADASRMEAASVHAFIALREELASHDAPNDLLDRARRAEADEVRHTRMTAKLARRFGAEEGAWSEPIEIKRSSSKRSLESIAIENVIEGCVNETYSALLAMWQSENARDEIIRDAMRVIAEDETRHAALAWSTSEWLSDTLPSSSRARVEQAFHIALSTLKLHAMKEPDRELVEAGILPSAEQAMRLVGSLESALSI